MKKDCKNFLKKRRIMLETLEDRRLLAVMGGALPMPQPTGAEIIVNSTTDPRTWSDTDSTVSLREAIETAQDGDVIKFDAKLNGKTITLSTSSLILTKSVTIDASNLSNGVTVSGKGALGIFVIEGEEDTSITVEMDNLSLVKGNSRRDEGGAIKAAQNVTLTLNDCTIENCESSSDGGGIYSRGTLTMNNCVVDSCKTNGVDDLGDGGGVYVQNANLYMTNCTITFNSVTNSDNPSGAEGGGVGVNGGTAYLTNCVIAGNTASGDGGGVMIHWYGNAVLTNCVIYGNSSENYGGGVANTSRGHGATLYNCTVAGNTAGVVGSGVYCSSDTIYLYNTIVSQNLNSDTAGSIDGSNNLVGKMPYFTVAPEFANGVLLNFDTIDLSLTENSSNAVDAGDNSYVSTETDFAGNPRIYQSYKESPTVDIGAYEYQGAVTPPELLFVVTTDQDVVDAGDGKLSLREALDSAGTGAVIKFDASLNKKTISLTLGQLNAVNVTIDASDLTDGITIDAHQESRIMLTTGTVTINNVSFINGNINDVGGAIYNQEVLTLNDCSLVGNTATSDGGAIYSRLIQGSIQLTLNNCLVSNNSGNAAVYSVGTLYVNNCVISDNVGNGGQGGAFGVNNALGGGQATIVDTLIVNNTCNDTGGAINIHYGGKATLINCVMYGNKAVYGGAIGTGSGRNNDVTLYNCTIAGNTANYGSGCHMDTGSMTAYNSIIAGNYGSDGAGGISLINSVNGDDPSFAVAPVFDGDGNLTNANTLDLSLAATSNLIDMGDNDYVQSELDFAGNPRIFQAYKDPATVDVGAYEYQGTIDPPELKIIVTTAQDVVDPDDGLISLREALNDAAMGMTIVFASSLDGATISLALGELQVSSSVTVDASELADGITIDAHGEGRVMTNSGTVTINNVSFINGNINDAGGAIYNQGNLTLNDCSVIGNTATSDAGGIYNKFGQTLTLNNCLVSNNSGNAAVYSVGTLYVNNCVVSDNVNIGVYGQGGAFGVNNALGGGQATIVDTLIVNNTCDDFGGAINIHYGATATLINCVIYGNKAAYGGAIGAGGGNGNVATLYNCTIAGNTAENGSGCHIATGSLTAYNSIIAENFNSDVAGNVNLVNSTTENAGFTVAPVFDDEGNLTNADTLDLSLTETSIAIDAGNNDYVQTETDFADNDRIFQAIVLINPATVDMGAYEYQSKVAIDTFIVTTAQDVVDADDGFISLREAIVLAANGAIVKFDSSLDGATISLALGELGTSGTLIIDASDLAGGITIDAHGEGRIMTNTGTVTINNVSFINGNINDVGGAIYNQAILTLNDCSLTGNTATSDGGAIYSRLIQGSVQLTLNNCLVSNNSGNAAVYSVGTLYVNNCVVSDNVNNIGAYGQGGAFGVNNALGGGQATIVDTLIVNNTCDTIGGAINIHYGATATLINCVMYGNKASYGGAIGTSSGSGNVATLYNCTIAGNTAENGSGCHIATGSLTAYNSIIAENFNPDVAGNVNLVNSTTEAPGFSVAPVFDDEGNLTNADAIDLSLTETSIAIDAGNNDYVQTETDFVGNPRISNEIVDLGAYEFQGGSVEQLATPTITAVASAGANRESVTWDAVENAAGYEVAYSTDQEEWTILSTTDTSLVVTGLTYGDQVYYQVKAVGNGAYSDSEWSDSKWLYVCPMDINGDRIVSGSDLTILSKAWFTRPSSANWDARADVDGSNMVNGSDLTWLSTNWLKRPTSSGLSYPAEKAQIFADADFDALDVDCDFALDADVDVFDDVF